MSSKSTSLTFYSKLDDVSPEQLRDSLQVRSYKTSAVESKTKNAKSFIDGFQGRKMTNFLFGSFLPS